jgi:hypothetical protein
LARRQRPEPAPEAALADRAIGLIDLRAGRRIPVDPISHGTPGLRPERPSRLRRRLEDGMAHPPLQHPLTREVAAPLIDLTQTAPGWSLERLRTLGLGEPLLAAVAAARPTTDLEWVEALAAAIARLLPADISTAQTFVVGEGRASAAGLLQELQAGKIPAFLLVDGQRLPATADELALSIRECIR